VCVCAPLPRHRRRTYFQVPSHFTHAARPLAPQPNPRTPTKTPFFLRAPPFSVSDHWKVSRLVLTHTPHHRCIRPLTIYADQTTPFASTLPPLCRYSASCNMMAPAVSSCAWSYTRTVDVQAFDRQSKNVSPTYFYHSPVSHFCNPPPNTKSTTNKSISRHPIICPCFFLLPPHTHTNTHYTHRVHPFSPVHSLLLLVGNTENSARVGWNSRCGVGDQGLGETLRFHLRID